MNFFEAQDSARARTRTLVVLFVAAVAAIIAAIYIVAHVAFGMGTAGVNVELLLAVALATGALVGIGSMVRTAQLRQGGAKVAELLGGRRVRSNTTDEAERRLINVVEEMAIASGTPMPAIYVMDNEPGINAFAAGYTMDDAAVAVTRGTLERLNRDELQGVIAHEFSHILNGDMRLNVRLMGILFGILLLAIVGRGLMRSGFYAGGGRSRRNNSGAQIAILGLGLVAVGYIGVFFGKLIQAAVSRQREFLADSSAVQFTRNPDGIAGALKKIGGAGSRIEDHHAQEAGHLFFANGMGAPFASLLATHPPLADRIRRLDPAFGGKQPAAPATTAARQPDHARAASAMGFAGSAATGSATGPHAASSAVPGGDTGALALVSGGDLLASIGAPQPEHVVYASRLLASIPADVRDAAHDPARAPSLLYALLTEADGSAAARTRDAVASVGGDELLAQVSELSAALQPLGGQVRLPLLDILLPALRELSPEEQASVRGTASRLVAADERLDMFEFALLHVLNRQLSPKDGRAAAEGPAVRAIAAVRAEIELILSAAAWSGADSEDDARAAFRAGADSLQRLDGGVALRPRADIELGAVDAAFGRVRVALPAIRGRVMEATSLVVAHDGRILVQEAEMLRAVAEAIDCPMPPVMQRTGPTA